MSSRRVNFTPSLNVTQPHPVPKTGESHSFQMQEAHQKWWGNFVPIANWEPPKIHKSKFDGMKIQSKFIFKRIHKSHLFIRVSDITRNRSTRRPSMPI